MTNEEIEEILAENKVRYDALFAKYDPLTGEGSLIPRTKVNVKGKKSILVPTYLAEAPLWREMRKYPSLYVYAKKMKIPMEKMLDFINEMRITYDFEYWAATCCFIRDKATGREINFILRQPQMKLLAVMIDDLFHMRPIRVKVLKARQWGGSTLIDMFFSWIQGFHRKNWNSVIAAHEMDATRNIRGMYSLMAEHHPKSICDFSTKNFEGSVSTKIMTSRGCIQSVACIRNPESIRSKDVKLAHMSEVGLWQDNKKVKGDDLAQSIIASVPDLPFTAIVLESTAKGIGNYFYRTWMADNVFKPVFVAWFEIDLYTQKFKDRKERVAFIESMTEEEWTRWRLGATLEGLLWYRTQEKTMPSAYRMKQEFPSTPQEAFATTGRFVHDPSDIDFIRGGCKPPVYVGTMVASAMYGKNAIDTSLHFQDDPSGDLYLWAMPDRSRNIRNRYIVSLDIGGRSDNADWSVISVIDRVLLMDGGVEQCIGTWKFHIDQDIAVWRAVQLAVFFNNALLVVEQNSLDSQGTEGDYSLTILDQIVDYYGNIYYRDDPTKIVEGVPPHYGFHTGRKEKVDIVTHWQKLLRDKLVIEYDERVMDECKWFEQKDRRDTYGAVDGQHDDMYMSRGIGLKVSSKWDLPKLVQNNNHNPNTSNTTIRTTAFF